MSNHKCETWTFEQNRHLCCDEASWYLFPPVSTINGEKIEDNWHIDLSGGGAIIPVIFCPFCGIKLDEPMSKGPLPRTP